MSSEIDDAVAALGPFLQSAESLLQEVPHPHIIPTSLPHPGPSPQPLSLQLSSMGTVAELQHEVALLTAPGSSAVGAFEAVSRIACGHPEGGGLQVPSLNWYEDSDVSAFMHRNGSRHSTGTPDNDSSERGRGGQGASGAPLGVGAMQGFGSPPCQVPSARSCSAAWRLPHSHSSSGVASNPCSWARSCTHLPVPPPTASWLR